GSRLSLGHRVSKYLSAIPARASAGDPRLGGRGVRAAIVHQGSGPPRGAGGAAGSRRQARPRLDACCDLDDGRSDASWVEPLGKRDGQSRSGSTTEFELRIQRTRPKTARKNESAHWRCGWMMQPPQIALSFSVLLSVHSVK